MVVFYSQAAAEEELTLIHKRWTSLDKQRQEEQQRIRDGKRQRRGSLRQAGMLSSSLSSYSVVPPEKVVFAEPEVVAQHESPHVPTLLEKQACFYDRRDRLSFERDRMKTAWMYERYRKEGRPWQESNMETIRGLEDFFSLQSKEHSRQEHVYAVLRAAARIKHEGYPSEEAFNDHLRYVSSESSAWARQHAKAMGLADEEALQSI